MLIKSQTFEYRDRLVPMPQLKISVVIESYFVRGEALTGRIGISIERPRDSFHPFRE